MAYLRSSYIVLIYNLFYIKIIISITFYLKLLGQRLRLFSIMRKLIYFLLVPVLACAQTKREHPRCQNKAFDTTVENLLSFTVPTISCKELYENRKQYYVLDARERPEYNVSHIVGARYVGYDDFDILMLKDIPRDAAIAIYCSVGYRSEKIGEKLQIAGFKNVKNVYGSIFEWINLGYPVVNNYDMTVPKVHAFNKTWGQWVMQKGITKVY
jgi:rhodanese-related sulfurtransferase